MEIRKANLIEKFCIKHADAVEPLTQWVSIVEAAQWKNHNDLKTDYPSADYVGNKRYVFNIKGNHYRLIVIAVFYAGIMDVQFIGTHAEYDKIKNIEKI
jgi:mRNA interferase HigB